MTDISNFTNTLPDFSGVFILMLSAFLIGYFSSWWLHKFKYRALISRLKKEVNEAKMQKNVNNIEAIFTEIKPKIIEVVKKTQNDIRTSSSYQTTAEKPRSSYVSYNKTKPSLDFKSFGYADENKKDDLTLIKGVGPYIELKLNEIGIYNYYQISRLKDSDIRIITELIDFFPGRIERDNWVGQAESLIKY